MNDLQGILNSAPDITGVEYFQNTKFTTYKSNVLIVDITTIDVELIEKIWCDYELYTEVQIAVSDISLAEHPFITEKFIVKDTLNEDYGIYALLDKSKLINIPLPEGAEINYSYEENKLKAVLTENNEVVGYIDFVNKYKNYFEIDWLFVKPEHRGKRYGTFLTASFSQYCIDNGFIPHYGTAISIYSENVALNCGFERVYWTKSFIIERR